MNSPRIIQIGTIVIFAGTNNMLNKCVPSNEFLQSLFASVSDTNVIIVTVPYCKGKYFYNKPAYGFNCKIFNIINQLNGQSVYYVDINNLLFAVGKESSTTHLPIAAKRLLLSHIFEIIQGSSAQDFKNIFVNFQNLISITTNVSHANINKLNHVSNNFFSRNAVTNQFGNSIIGDGNVDLRDDSNLKFFESGGVRYTHIAGSGCLFLCTNFRSIRNKTLEFTLLLERENPKSGVFDRARAPTG